MYDVVRQSHRQGQPQIEAYRGIFSNPERQKKSHIYAILDQE